MRGKIFLIPNYLSEHQQGDFISPMVGDVIRRLDYFLVENIRTSRRFISSLNLGIDISSLTFEEMDKRFDAKELPRIMEPVLEGKDLGIQSEAGLPGIADPGKLAVAYAHEHNLPVVTLPGSSSIILGLISSGFNGQAFTFHGYLPIDKNARIKKIRDMESEVRRSGYTQVFMETPYRNNELINALVTTLQPNTQLYIGANITSPGESIRTMSIKKWQDKLPDLHKVPSIFAIGVF